ncbi:MAG TPA: hypothetical protein VFZ04_16695, partial [Longimicrobiales bacterium]
EEAHVSHRAEHAAEPGASRELWSRLAFEQYRELATSFRNTWDVYVKFFTVFITFNVIAIGAVLERVDPANRPLMAAAFIAQNVLAAGTALGVASYSRVCKQQLERTADVLVRDANDPADRAVLRDAPIPGTTGVWAGFANFIAHLTLIAVWILVATMN